MRRLFFALLLFLGAWSTLPAYDAASNRLSVTYLASTYGLTYNLTLNSGYDALNRVANITEVATAGNRTTTYHYDLAGRRLGLLDASGSNITTTYDTLGRQTEIKGNGNATLVRYDYVLAYDEYSNLGRQAETYANGNLMARTLTLIYDNADRLTRESMVTGSTNITSNYTYDNGYNRLTRITSNVSNSSVSANLTYTYDAANQLNSYHDTVANITTNLTYNAAGDRTGLVTKNLATNTVSSNLAYSYDEFNRLLGISNATISDTIYNYAYDYRGRRVIRGQYAYGSPNTENITPTLFDGGNPVREQQYNYSGSGNSTPTTTLSEYIRGSDWGGGVGGILYSLHISGNTATPNYYHYDGRGDVIAETSSTGTVSFQADYDAYGGHANTTTKGTQSSGTNTDPFYSSTKEEDPSGLVNEGLRYRDLATDTFLTPDPLGDIDGPNRYTYVRDNPMTHFDPEGLMTEDDYSNDEGLAQKQARADEQNDYRAYQRGDYGDPNSQTAKDKFNTLSDEEEANRDARIQRDKEGIGNLEATAKWAREHNIAVNEATLDDDPGHSSSMGPSLEKLLDVPENGTPSAGQSQYSALRGQMTSSDMKEVAKQAAILGVTDGAGKLLEGAGEALAALKGGSAEEDAIAGKLTGYTKHGINSAISHDGVGVSPQAILDALKNPGSMVKQADGAIKYVGKDATVVLNKDGKLITTWANSGAGVRAP